MIQKNCLKVTQFIVPKVRPHSKLCISRPNVLSTNVAVIDRKTLASKSDRSRWIQVQVPWQPTPVFLLG